VKPPVVELIDVCKTYVRGEERVTGLDHLSFQLFERESLALVGPSGCGKSTTLNLISAIDVPDSGTLRVHGLDLHAATRAQLTRLRRESVGVVFQSFHLMPYLSVEENIDLPQRLCGRRDPRRVRELLCEVGLEHRAKHFPSQLSGGEQQRVAIARALVNRPFVLLADEPTGNLDSASSSSVLKLMHELRRTHGSSLILATHEEKLARSCDRVLHFLDGRLADPT